MKKALGLLLVLVLLGGFGFAAYKLGWLNRVTSPAGIAPGESNVPGAASSASAAGVQPNATAAPAPSTLPVKIAQVGQPAVNQAIELRVAGVRTATSIGDRTAPPGRVFVIVDTAWKNLLQPQRVNRKAAADRTQGAGSLGFGGGTTPQQRAEDEANTTIESVAFRVESVPDHLWLVADGRAESIDAEATAALEGHLPLDSLDIAKFQEVRTGGYVFQAPAGAQSLSLLLLDSNHGHVLVAARGAAPEPVGGFGPPARGNDVFQFTVTGTSWADAGAQPGTRTLVLTVRGVSRKDAVADVPFGEFGFLQTDEGCIAQPEENSPAVTQPLSPIGRFLPIAPREGQLAFIVPASTRGATFMFRASGSPPIDVPALGTALPQRPPTRATFQDGSVLRVSIVGIGAAPAGSAPAPAGSEHLVIDYLVENLQSAQGLELQADPQFDLADGGGQLYAPDAESMKLPCRLTGSAVVPVGGWRRFSLAYTVPAGQPLSLKYRGFEQEGALKVR